MSMDNSIEYYVLDTETTGVNTKKHEVTEISIVRCSDRHQLTRLIKAEHPENVQPQALEATGRTYEDLLKGESRHTAVAACNAFFEQDGKTPEHRCIVAHNAGFDKRFCHALWESCEQNFPAVMWMDTIKVFKLWCEGLGRKPENFKLGTVVKFAGIKAMPGAHDAGSDARNTYLLWKKAMDLKLDYLAATKRYPHHVIQQGASDMDFDMSDAF